MKKMNELECLKGALTLLVQRNILTLHEVEEAINTGGFNGLWDLINHKYFDNPTLSK